MIAISKQSRSLVVFVVATAATASCTSQDAGRSAPAPGRRSGSQSSAAVPSSNGGSPLKTSASTIVVTSSGFENGQSIPKKFTEDGQDVSPPLAWKDVPAGTKQLALVCDDPDAPTPEPWVHWVLYAVPADVRSLHEGIEPNPRLTDPKGAMQGKNSWPRGQTIGYRGPAPPKGHGMHHYHFKLYALDADLKLQPELTKNELLAAIKPHILAQGELVGQYERK